MPHIPQRPEICSVCGKQTIPTLRPSELTIRVALVLATAGLAVPFVASMPWRCGECDELNKPIRKLYRDPEPKIPRTIHWTLMEILAVMLVIGVILLALFAPQ